jgi:hypothetical protein
MLLAHMAVKHRVLSKTLLGIVRQHVTVTVPEVTKSSSRILMEISQLFLKGAEQEKTGFYFTPIQIAMNGYAMDTSAIRIIATPD